ncbi:hypothetical protein [Allokutzneria albata]|uniref:Diphtheria toxin, T domain n=1 Tax=Allokutzneria albata TaxID=211114 RepID=A0A1G9SDF8_ALLAB|nr:hypothetical protein [Allokutzneria albata]SDM33526.1 Diphtheria toxin, T domain [Allokutzneria albata]
MRQLSRTLTILTTLLAISALLVVPASAALSTPGATIPTGTADSSDTGKVTDDRASATTVLAFRLRAGCVRKPDDKVCKAIGATRESARKFVANILSKSEKATTTLAASNDYKSSMKGFSESFAKLRKAAAETKKPIPTADIKKLLTPHLDKVSTVKDFKKYFTNLKPSQGSAATWLVNLAATVANEESSKADVAVAAAGIIPVVGQVAAIANSVSQGDVEGTVTSAIALAANIAIAVGAGPLGTAILAGLAVYSLGKAFIAWMSVKKEQEAYKDIDVDSIPKGKWEEYANAKLGIEGAGKDKKAILHAGADGSKATFSRNLTVLVSPPKDTMALQTYGAGIYSQRGMIPLRVTFWRAGERWVAACKIPTGGIGTTKPQYYAHYTCTRKADNVNAKPESPVVIDYEFEISKDVCANFGCPDPKLDKGLAAYFFVHVEKNKGYSVGVPYGVVQ